MKKKNIFLWILLFVFLTTYNLNLTKGPINSFFEIKKIEINDIQNVNTYEVSRNLEIFYNQNIITTKKKEIGAAITNVDFVKDMKIKKIYPDKIKILIVEDKPIGIFMDNGNKYILVESGKIIKTYNEKFNFLPLIYGKNANKKFPLFYKTLEESNFEIQLVNHFVYFEADRWDLVLKNEKLIKLPSDNNMMSESLKKFLSIYQKEKFKRFKVFDFRVKNQLIMK